MKSRLLSVLAVLVIFAVLISACDDDTDHQKSDALNEQRTSEEEDQAEENFYPVNNKDEDIRFELHEPDNNYTLSNGYYRDLNSPANDWTLSRYDYYDYSVVTLKDAVYIADESGIRKITLDGKVQYLSKEVSPALATDGKTILFSVLSEKKQYESIYAIHSIGTDGNNEKTLLKDCGEDAHPIMIDQNYLYFFNRYGLQKGNLKSGKIKRIGTLPYFLITVGTKFYYTEKNNFRYVLHSYDYRTGESENIDDYHVKKEFDCYQDVIYYSTSSNMLKDNFLVAYDTKSDEFTDVVANVDLLAVSDDRIVYKTSETISDKKEQKEILASTEAAEDREFIRKNGDNLERATYDTVDLSGDDRIGVNAEFVTKTSNCLVFARNNTYYGLIDGELKKLPIPYSTYRLVEYYGDLFFVCNYGKVQGYRVGE